MMQRLGALRPLVVARRSMSVAAAVDSAPPAQAEKKKAKVSEKRIARKKEHVAKREKTALCTDFLATGKCSRANCTFAHGFGELKSPVYFDRAQELADARGSRITADDLIQARTDLILAQKSKFSSLLGQIGAKKELVSNVEWSSEKLDFVRMVQKVSITIPINVLANQWHVNTDQLTVLKKVLGPRYDPEENEFKLTRRNRAPFTEVADEQTVFDALIDRLVLMVSEVKRVVPPIYSFEEDTTTYRAHPPVVVQPVASESS